MFLNCHKNCSLDRTFIKVTSVSLADLFAVHRVYIFSLWLIVFLKQLFVLGRITCCPLCLSRAYTVLLCAVPPSCCLKQAKWFMQQNNEPKHISPTLEIQKTTISGYCCWSCFYSNHENVFFWLRSCNSNVTFKCYDKMNKNGTGDLSWVYPASRPMTAGIGPSPPATWPMD